MAIPIVPLVVATALFMENTDSTILATALHLLILGVLLFGGFLRSLQFTSLSAITYADLEARQIGAATSIASVAQQVSISLGVATGAMVLEISEVLRGHEIPMTADFSAAFVVVGLMSMVSALLMLRLPEGAGDEISGRALPASAPGAR